MIFDMNNICLASDSYKMGHYKMYPEETTKVFSYLEARAGAKYNKTLFFGLQYLLKRYLEGQVVTKEKIQEAKRIIDVHLGPGVFNEDGWNHILDEHRGYLPVEIKAVPEGKLIPVGNVLMTVENTCDNSYWLTNYLESLLLHVWDSINVATLTYEIRKMFKFYSNITCENQDHLDFQLHDFGYRGASSHESAIVGGSGHLLNFKGTDTVPALLLPMNFYNSDVVGFSVAATEHSVMTSLGQDGEMKVFKHILDNTNGILSVVCDSYNDEQFIRNCFDDEKFMIKPLSDFILRDGNNKLVYRPDSGDPVTTTLKILNTMEEYIHVDKNSKGFKVLHSQFGVLFGDGLNYHKIRDILFALKNNGWATSNVVFGMGGGLHTDHNRDTQRFAFKSSAQYRNGKWFDIQKNPLDSTKKSKAGVLDLFKIDGEYKTVKVSNIEPVEFVDSVQTVPSQLNTVFKDGELVYEYHWDEVKRNIND